MVIDRDSTLRRILPGERRLAASLRNTTLLARWSPRRGLDRGKSLGSGAGLGLGLGQTGRYRSDAPTLDAWVRNGSVPKWHHRA